MDSGNSAMHCEEIVTAARVLQADDMVLLAVAKKCILTKTEYETAVKMSPLVVLIV